MNLPRFLVSTLSTSLPLVAQALLPPAAMGVAGNAATGYPWNRLTAGTRVLTVYDTGVPFSGIAGPVRITALRWRANRGPGSWSGGTFGAATVRMSTAAGPHATLSATFDDNHGADVVTVHQGAVVVTPGTGNPTVLAGPTYVEIVLAQPFYHDPADGDLAVELLVDGTTWTGGTSRNSDVVLSANANASRVWANAIDAVTGTLQPDCATVVELDVAATSLLRPLFSAGPTAGPAPLVVDFHDASQSAAGVVAWEWDVDGDGATDYTTQNPTHTYTDTGCVAYDVTLTVTDALGVRRTHRMPSFVRVNEPSIDFTWDPIGPETLRFDALIIGQTGTPEWDFDDDGVVDAVGTSVTHTYAQAAQQPAGTRFTPAVTVRASSLCGGTISATKGAYVGRQLESPLDPALALPHRETFFDIEVHNPFGISITAFARQDAPNSSSMFMYVGTSPGGYAGKVLDLNAWRMRPGFWTSEILPSGQQIMRPPVTEPPLYLPPGRHGIRIRTAAGNNPESQLATPGTAVFGNADLTIHPGAGTTDFGFTVFEPRVWNGVVYYQTADSSRIAGYGYRGLSCSFGNIGPAFLDAVPRLGTTAQMPVWGLSANGLGVFALGLTPMLLPIGSQGCLGHVAPDVLSLLLGDANGFATATLAVPNDPQLVGFLFYSQAMALVLSPTSIDLVPQDAHAGVVGY